MPKISMTVQRLKSLKAIGGKRTEYQDNKTEGLGFRVTPTGAKSWFMLYYRQSDKKKRRVTLGKYPALGLADARKAARELLTAIEQGQDPAGQKQAKKGADTFEELAGFYIKRHAMKKNKARTWKEDQRMITHDLLPVIGGMKADQVTKQDVIKLVSAIEDRGNGYLSNHVLVLVRKIYNWAIDDDLQTFNPATGIKKRHEEVSRDRYLLEPEIKQFWDRIDDTSATFPTKTILELCLLTGQRVGEVSGAAKSEINMVDKVWNIPKERVKNKRPHAIPLVPMALERFTKAIEQGRASSAYVFPSRVINPDKPILSGVPSRLLHRSKDIIGLDYFRVHDLRRTVATHMTRIGIDRLHVSKVLNHASVDSETITGMVYDRNDYMKEKRAALELWESYLASILEGTDFNIVPFNQINQAG